MARVEAPEVFLQLRISVLIQIHIPYALVVAEKRILRCSPPDSRFQAGACQGKRTTLASAHAAHARFIHLRESHDNASQLGRVQENRTEQKLLRAIVQAADDVAV